LGEEERIQQPAEDTSSDGVTACVAAEHKFETISIFSLSGGLMRPAAKTANRIDGLLARMLLQPGTGGYKENIDKNLDYLFTSLQLDMINMAAEGSAEEQEQSPIDEEAYQEVRLQLGPPIHDNAREG